MSKQKKKFIKNNPIVNPNPVTRMGNAIDMKAITNYPPMAEIGNRIEIEVTPINGRSEEFDNSLQEELRSLLATGKSQSFTMTVFEPSQLSTVLNQFDRKSDRKLGDK